MMRSGVQVQSSEEFENLAEARHAIERLDMGDVEGRLVETDPDLFIAFRAVVSAHVDGALAHGWFPEG